MANGCSSLGTSNCGATGICEEVKHLYRSAGRGYQLAHPIPVSSLLGEKAGMLKAHGLDLKAEISVVYIPTLGKPVFAPRATARVASLIAGVCAHPKRITLVRLPYYLRIWTNKAIFAPVLELLALRCIYYLIVFPIICKPHNLLPLIEIFAHCRAI